MCSHTSVTVSIRTSELPAFSPPISNFEGHALMRLYLAHYR
jgi:hypothetical protein